MSTSSTSSSRPKTTPFTPKRPLSSTSLSDSAKIARPSTNSTSTPSASNLLSTTHKKYKAPLSSDARPRGFSKSRTTLAPVPGTPTKSDDGRPKTPGSPRKATDSPLLMPSTSEMDVSRVDPEEVLVDYQTVEPGDVSAEMDEAWLKTINQDHGKHDKVMVSVRIRPSNHASAWSTSPSSNSIQLDPTHSRNSTLSSNASTTNFNFDSILTGTPNKPIYTTVARSHVHAAMEGFNSVIFAYGQTASGKTYTLTGSEDEPGIIPRAMKDVFAFIKGTSTREYLLRCSYLEIYNENINDLLAPPPGSVVQLQGGIGNEIILTPLREEVVTSLKGVRDVLKRGEAHRRTATTDWNERSSRSHSIFRLVIESRERGASSGEPEQAEVMNGRQTPGNGRQTPGNGRQTPGLNGRQTPGLSGRQTPGPPPTPGGPRLQARGGRSVRTSVLSLIDLAGSEKATSDKERTREGKYINTSLLTLGSVIGALSENAAKRKNDHVPYRNSKLTRMLQPSLSGNARISVVCTINPDVGAIAETTSTLLFAKRVKGVKLNAQKKEVVDTDALIERYVAEIDDLKRRLAEREVNAAEPVRKRRLSRQDQIDESKAMKDLNNRIQQLTKLILTSQTVEEGAESRPASPVKVDFDMEPYQLQQELLAARHQLESQATQILSLEAALSQPSADENEKDRVIFEQRRTIDLLEASLQSLEAPRPQAPSSSSPNELEREWAAKLQAEVTKREESERWAEELVKQLDREKKNRAKLEDQARALSVFVQKVDSLGLGVGSSVASALVSPKSPQPKAGGAAAAFAERQRARQASSIGSVDSPLKGDLTGQLKSHPSLLDQTPEEDWNMDLSFDDPVDVPAGKVAFPAKRSQSPSKEVLGDKENFPC